MGGSNTPPTGQTGTTHRACTSTPQSQAEHIPPQGQHTPPTGCIHHTPTTGCAYTTQGGNIRDPGAYTYTTHNQQNEVGILTTQCPKVHSCSLCCPKEVCKWDEQYKPKVINQNKIGGRGGGVKYVFEALPTKQPTGQCLVPDS